MIYWVRETLRRVSLLLWFGIIKLMGGNYFIFFCTFAQYYGQFVVYISNHNIKHFIGLERLCEESLFFYGSALLNLWVEIILFFFAPSHNIMGSLAYIYLFIIR